jgi:MoaA/NifB/PqqE/SkfB family radical SAM enzyme
VTRVPLRVLRELRRRGVRRLPAAVERELAPSAARPRTLAFARRWLAGERLTRHRGQWVVNSFMPPFPGRAYERMFENLLSGRHLSPVSAYLAVTHACPYHCWHCSLRDRRPGHLDTAAWRAVIAQLHELGASLIGFTGGEPLLRADLAELVRAAAAPGAATILFTSGAEFDDARASELAAAGLWSVCVSLDHPDRDACDRLRGHAGAYDTALAALRRARADGFYTMAATVATRRVVRERLFEPLHTLAGRHGAHEYRLVEPMPCGALRGAPDDTRLEAADIAVLRAFHIETNRRGCGPKVCAFNQVESPEFFGCGAGTQHLFIDPAGEVCPCDFTPLSFGNVTTTSLADIWRRMNLAMGDNPRRHCFIQRHHRLVAESADGQGFPLPPACSEAVCRAAGREPLPDYFALVTGQQTGE